MANNERKMRPQNSDPYGTVYEDGSVKGIRRAGDSPDDFMGGGGDIANAPPGTVFEDGSVKGGRRAGDSPDDFGASGAPIVW